MNKLIDRSLTVVSILAFVFLLLKIFVFQQVNVIGVSMEETFFQGEKLVLYKAETKVKRGDVVSVFEYPEMAEDSNVLTKTFPSLSGKDIKYLLKRVIALPGEEIEIIGSTVILYNTQYPNGAVLNETYLSSDIRSAMEKGCPSYGYYMPKKKVEQNTYFLMGDNRCFSADSRDTRLGTFSQDLILGRVIYKYWPINQAQTVHFRETEFENIDEATKNKIENARSEYQKSLSTR